jgi:hypothetical protein
VFRREIKKAAGLEILNHAAVTMQQDERLSASPLDVMQPHSAYLDKPPAGRIFSFCFAAPHLGYDCGAGQNRRESEPGGAI